jgi:hypothetical protein
MIHAQQVAGPGQFRNARDLWLRAQCSAIRQRPERQIDRCVVAFTVGLVALFVAGGDISRRKR